MSHNRFFIEAPKDTSPLPGGEKGWYQRRLQSTYGITPTVGGGETRNEKRLRERGHKPDRDGHWEPVGTHGTVKWVPDV